jgi:hypothetical protein
LVEADFFIQRVKLTVEPEGITPEVFGTPACVSNALMRYSPTATPLRLAEAKVTEATSGFEVLS